jgi:hypothetical protein
MTLCPIALMATCNKCTVVGFCPLKEVIGDHKPVDVTSQAQNDLNNEISFSLVQSPFCRNS